MLVAGSVLAAAGQSTSTASASSVPPKPKAAAPLPAKPAVTTATTTTTTAKPASAPATVSRTELARQRAAAKAKQAALERQQREANASGFKRDSLGNLVPDVHAAAAIVFNPQTNEVLFEANSHDQRAIASLTKVMTAVTFIADDPDLTQDVLVTRADVLNASVTYLKAGDRLKLGDVLHLALIPSDNGAARVLARTSEGGTAAFVTRMNEMARQLGLSDTHYADPTGLDSDNVSSAFDYSHLISFAVQDERLGPVMRTQEYEVQPSNRVAFTIHSTNKLLGTDVDVRGGKTGFIAKAGYCLATLLQIPQGSQVAVVVLGAANSATRFGTARLLFNWVVGRAQGVVGGGGDEQNHKQ
jgi:D-alanyl-D-alanine endopeptidase (penicillin-binding protein 7)